MFTLRWARLMFDYLRSTDKKPNVISGEDVVGNAEALLDALSEALGIARGGLRVSWSLVSPEERRKADWAHGTLVEAIEMGLPGARLAFPGQDRSLRMPRGQPDV
jgi:hypothetical protein